MLLTPQQVATIVGYKSHVSVLRAVKRRELKAVRVNCRVIRFRRSDVDAWIELLAGNNPPRSIIIPQKIQS